MNQQLLFRELSSLLDDYERQLDQFDRLLPDFPSGYLRIRNRNEKTHCYRISKHDGIKKEYPIAECTLDYEKAWQLLVSVRLAAQCTDARVDQITPLLYEKFPDVAALAAAEPEEIEEIVRPCGLGRSKARDISACMRVLHDQYDDHVPETFEELLALPGVGRKSANLIMGDVFGKPAIVTDTHCIRLCNLIGLVDNIKEPAKVERELWKIIPPEEGNDLCHRFVHHGRAVCVARRPQCTACCLRDICRHGKNRPPDTIGESQI